MRWLSSWALVGEFAIQRASGAELDVVDSAISLKGVMFRRTC